MTDDDRYTRITLRIPKELHARLDTEAEKTSKSLNAEIVARIEAGFRAPTSDEVLSLKKDVDIARLTAQKDKVDLLGAKLLALEIAELVPAEDLQSKPALIKVIEDLRSQRKDLLLEMLETMFLGLVDVRDTLNSRVASGVVKVVSTDGDRQKGSQTLENTKRAGSAFVGFLESLDKETLLELIERPKIRNLLDTRDFRSSDAQAHGRAGETPTAEVSRPVQSSNYDLVKRKQKVLSPRPPPMRPSKK